MRTVVAYHKACTSTKGAVGEEQKGVVWAVYSDRTHRVEGRMSDHCRVLDSSDWMLCYPVERGMNWVERVERTRLQWG